MGKGSSSTPAAPDPVATANAQSQYNKDAALYQAQLNNVNQVTPYGNLTYSQTSGAPTYDYDAYNKALSAYQAAASAPQQASNISGPYQNGENSSNSFYIPGQPQTPQASSAPKLSDYQTNSGAAPGFTSTITLSPEQQKILDNQQSLQQQQQGIAGTALNQAQANQANPYDLAHLTHQLASATDVSNQENTIYQSLLQRLQPQLDRDQSALESKLANQGITQGSQAYNNAINLQNQAKNDAYNQALLSGVSAGQTYNQEALANNQQDVSNYSQQYNAPINEYQALQNGVQVQNPSFAASGNNQVAAPNYQGAVQNAYQAQLNSSNASNASSNSLMGSLFGLGGSFLGNAGLGSILGSGASSGLSSGALALAGFSDIRMKENIDRIGQTPGGIGIYEYNYIGRPERMTGVIAQEVEKVIPEAVVTGEDGYKRVYYSKVK